MAFRDHYGNLLSTRNADAVGHYNIGVAAFLSANAGAVEAFGDAVDCDANFALGHAGLARALMMAGRMPEAKAALAAAMQGAATSHPREQRHIRCFELLFAGKPAQCRELVREHMRDTPTDALVAQLCTSVFGLIGFSGEIGREADLLAFTTSLLPHYPSDWWMMGIHAVSLCETGQVDASLALMERSLALNDRNANASHFKAHALYETGQTSHGRQYLSNWLKTYDPQSVLHGHLSWHVALWALDEGDMGAMWQSIDASIGPSGAKGLPINILTDTAAILYRAELAGEVVAPERWRDLSDYAAKFFPSTGQSFADMHAALSHAMAGEGDRLALIADTAKGFAGDLVRPVARAWGAIARQDWTGALDEMIPVMATTERLGGSRAQRDLLELAYLNVLLKLGRADEARRTMLTRRPVFDAGLPLAH